MQRQVRFRTGLVGAGYISEYHLRALRRLPTVEVVGVHDTNLARASSFAAQHKVAAFESIAALRSAGANVIHVLTPPHAHAAVALEALESGCHVLVEKPLAVCEEDCERISKRAEELDLRVCVNHSLLFDPQIRHALSVVRSGKLGKIVSLDFIRSSAYPDYSGGQLPPQYRSAGYPFRDLGVHALYLFEAFLGPIKNVEAQWASLGGDPNLPFDEWRALVHCRDGIGQFQLSWNVRPLQSQLIIHGTKGVLHVDLFLMFHATRTSTRLPKAAERVVNAIRGSLGVLTQVPLNVALFASGRLRPYHGLGDMVSAFYDTLERGLLPPVPAADAGRVVRWTERIATAADADHEVRRSRLRPLCNASVLVTGGSGALGSAIVDRLRQQGERVRMLVRRIPDNAPSDVELAIGDLGDPEAVSEAVRGVQTVVHCGAAMKGGWPQHRCATVVGTENVLTACKAQQVRKLVHISSLSVVDWAGADRSEAVNEDSPLEPRPQLRGSYTRAKLEAERLVSGCAASDSFKAIILRPGQIFGRKIPLLTAAVARQLGKRWLILGDGDLSLPLVYIDDVVDAVVAAIGADLRHGEVIQIIDPESLTQNAVLARAIPGARVIRIPRQLVLVLGKCSEFAFGLLRRQSPISRYRLRSAMARLRFDSHRAGQLLGWHPHVGLSEGIGRCIESSDDRQQFRGTRGNPEPFKEPAASAVQQPA